MKAVVMAGGEGSRLRPLTLGRPKPMLPVVNRPLLSHILYLLHRHGITEAVVTLQYMATQIQDYFADGRQHDIEISYVVEESPLGTAGSVRHAQSLLAGGEPFLVISGDALTDFDLTSLIAFHKQRGAALTMALSQVPDPLEYGVVNLAADGRVMQFLEKPSWGAVTSDTVNAGVYVVEPEVMQLIGSGERLDWSQDVFPSLMAQGALVYGYVARGYWCDIGTLAEYHRANADLLRGKLDLGELGQRIGPDIWAGGPVEIDPSAQLVGPVYLGNEARIKSGAIVQGPAVVRDYTIVDSRARVDRSVVFRNCYIGEGAEIHGAVIGRQCSLKARAAIFEGAVVGDGSVIGQDAVIQSGVKIWPNKEVEPATTVNHSIIWGSQGRRVLFGRYGVTGVVNVDLTPDFVARLGAAYGSTMPKGSYITINRDPHRSPRMIKRALISGLPSAGNNVLDLRTLPIPVARYYTRVSRAAGGVHVRLSPYDERVVDIRFMGADGLNLTRDQERQIERIFFREDYRRAYMEDIGNIEYAPDAAEVYGAGYGAALDANAIRLARFKVVVDYAHAPAAEVLPELLDHLAVEAMPLNARVDANRISPSQAEHRAARAQLARITGALDDITLGVRLDVGGERIFVADDRGASIPDDRLAAAMAALVLRTYPGGTIVVTADQSTVFEQIAVREGGRVRRCPVDSQALMLAASDDEVVMAADGAGNFVFADLHPAIDGLLAVGKLLELLARQRVSLSEVVASLPPAFVATGAVEGEWASRGRVMRCLIRQFAKLQHETLDGIKIVLGEREWVLIRPDGETSMFHLTAEARSAPAAMELIADYSAIVRGYVVEPCSEDTVSDAGTEPLASPA